MILKEDYIKTSTCYYFDDTIKIKYSDSDHILIDEKSCKNILVYDISHKILFGSKPFRIRFDEVYGFIRVYDRIKYWVLFAPEKYDVIYNRIRYLISRKIVAFPTFFLTIIKNLWLIIMFLIIIKILIKSVLKRK